MPIVPALPKYCLATGFSLTASPLTTIYDRCFVLVSKEFDWGIGSTVLVKVSNLVYRRLVPTPSQIYGIACFCEIVRLLYGGKGRIDGALVVVVAVRCYKVGK